MKLRFFEAEPNVDGKITFWCIDGRFEEQNPPIDIQIGQKHLVSFEEGTYVAAIIETPDGRRHALGYGLK